MKKNSTDSPNVNRTSITPPHGWSLPDFRELYRYRDLLWMLTTRNVAVIYRQSFFGIGWAVIRPVITALIFTVIFGRLAGFDSHIQSTSYPLFVLAGLVIWNFFATSLANTSESVVAQANVISKTYFPRLILPLSAIGVASIDFLIQLALLLTFMVLFASTPTIAILTLPLWFAATTVASLAIGIWLTALNVRFRDVKHAVPFFIQTMLYLTPVIYPVSFIPQRWQWLISLNPMFSIVQGFRWSLLGTEPPNWGLFLLSLLVTTSLLFGGLIFFRRVESTFADII
jgi:lipopolysaccharide transport system permease protein